MAWHTIKETLKLTGRSRSQLYRDMAKGLVSYRIGKNERREFETSELIRVYGELHIDETMERHNKGHEQEAEEEKGTLQLEDIRQQLASLQQTLTLMLEDKSKREMEKYQQEAEREQLLSEITSLRKELIVEKSKGFWARIFRK